MGGCVSCCCEKSLSSSSWRRSSSVRLVHLSGYVEDFGRPISVREVAGTAGKHFVCNSTQLLSSKSEPLQGDVQLQPGRIYFLLPYSVLQSGASPLDLAALAKRLTAAAGTARLNDKNAPRPDTHAPLRSPRRWKPVLDTIREKSFSRPSESDLSRCDE